MKYTYSIKTTELSCLLILGNSTPKHYYISNFHCNTLQAFSKCLEIVLNDVDMECITVDHQINPRTQTDELVNILQTYNFKRVINMNKILYRRYVQYEFLYEDRHGMISTVNYNRANKFALLDSDGSRIVIKDIDTYDEIKRTDSV